MTRVALFERIISVPDSTRYLVPLIESYGSHRLSDTHSIRRDRQLSCPGICSRNFPIKNDDYQARWHFFFDNRCRVFIYLLFSLPFGQHRSSPGRLTVSITRLVSSTRSPLRSSLLAESMCQRCPMRFVEWQHRFLLHMSDKHSRRWQALRSTDVVHQHATVDE